MTGSQWNLSTLLEDLELVDDICLTSEKQQHLQQKSTRVADTARQEKISQIEKCLQMCIGFAIWQHD
jgi:hypothetical protein